MNCSLAQTLEVVGERWTMLILRDAFFGIRRFEEFQRRLGIARNILSARLSHLVTEGILERHSVSPGGKWAEYRLTAKGKALQPALLALVQWGDYWYPNEDGIRVEFFDRRSGDSILPIRAYSQDGEALEPRDIGARPGPGGPKNLVAKQ
ncbi:MAG: helix-turn-helix transcriptional regulator [Gammaproteobacteria bacterium]|nr:helix-turn-helix transcriptional regulator [Gammaproteobacteria bacterium]